MRTSSAVVGHKFWLTACLLAGMLQGSGWANSAEVSRGPNSGVLPSGLPFSEAVRVDDTLYLSGQVGVVSGRLELVAGGIIAESKQVMDNIKAVLAANQMGMSDVVKCTVMLADIAEWDAFNVIYKTYFEPPYPARSAMGVNGLALGARVEVECLAVYSD